MPQFQLRGAEWDIYEFCYFIICIFVVQKTFNFLESLLYGEIYHAQRPSVYWSIYRCLLRKWLYPILASSTALLAPFWIFSSCSWVINVIGSVYVIWADQIVLCACSASDLLILLESGFPAWSLIFLCSHLAFSFHCPVELENTPSDLLPWCGA